MNHPRTNKKRLSFLSLLVAIALLLRPISAIANPVGGVVAAGQANIITAPTTVDIHQQTHKVVIDWRGFDIAPGERTEFHQPSASAIALNRVNSNAASNINGTLKANGNIIIVNQNGVLFGKQAVVDVNGLVATSADTDNDRFINESKVTLDKAGNPDALVSNEGSITAKESGLVGFVAPRVENSGVITARLGRVHLASGEKATVDFYGDGLLEVAVGDEATHQLAKNTGAIHAQGGTIALTAAAGRKLLSSGIEVGGELHAQTVSEQEGKIIIAAEGNNAVTNNIAANKNGSNSNVASTVKVDGKLRASGDKSGEYGGNITITGDEISLKSGSNISARGAAGGGVIRIGGEYLGRGTTPTARNTTVESGVIIDASATEQGHGGEVIVFADGDTIFNGLIYANGAGLRGNGGFVETSGKSRLHIGGAVEASASQGGLAGQWLLDPADITITAATNSNITGTTPFIPTNTASQLSVATIVAALNAGTNVTVQTNNDAFAGNGDIFVNSAITSTGVGALTISAFRNILVNAAINLNGGDLTLRSDNTGIGSGAVSTAAAINTNGGDITIGGGSGAITAATFNANGSIATAATGFAAGNAALANGVTIGGAINAGNNGNIIINGRGFNGAVANVGVEQLVGNAITATGTGSIRISGIAQGTGGNASANFGVALRNLVSTQNGVLQINGRGGNGTGQQNFGVLFSNAGGVARSTGTGALTISGTGGTGTGGRNYGVLVNNASGISPTGSGTVLVFGQGGTGGTTNSGVVINDAGVGSIVGGGGAITVNGFGGNTALSNNYGVALVGTGAGIGVLSNSGAGSITVNGTGAGSGAGANNYGVLISGTGARISTSGTGAISVTGTGGGGTGGNNYGVLVNSAGGITTTGSSPISITGQGGNAGVNAVGVLIGSTGSVIAGASAITVNGTGGTSNGSSSHGVQLNGGGAGTGALTSTTGAVNITGIGAGGGATNNNHGIFLSGTGATIAKTGGGAFTLTGTGGTGSGGSNHGIFSSIGDGITSAANATLNATAGAGANSAGIVSDVTNGIRTTSAAILTFLSNTYNIAAAGAVNSASTLTIAPLTASTTLGLGTGAGVATINNASLANLAATTGFTFGSATTSDITVNTTAPFTSRALTFISAGNITLNNGFQNLTSLTTTAPTGTTTINAAIGGVTAIGAFTATGRDIIFNASLRSSAAISAAFTRDITVAAAATLTNGAASALTLTAANNNTAGTGNLTINGNLSVGTGALTLLSGINGTRPSFIATTTNLQRQGATFGAIDIRGFQDFTINRDINTTSNITIFAQRDLTLNAANTLTTAPTGGVNLQAANGNTNGVGNLNLNGTLSLGSTNTVTLRSGANGTRPSYTATAANFIRQGATFGAIDIQGFQDFTINRDINSIGNVGILAFRDITLNAGNILSTGAVNSLNLQAVNGNTGGVGNLNLNGTISVGTGNVTLRSGQNGTRPNYTATAANFVRQGTTFGAIDIQGFQDTSINRDINSSGNITILSRRNLTLNAANTLTTGAASGIRLEAANGNTGGTGNLNLNGIISVGTGALTLRSGANGTRPSYTATAANLIRQGATFGTIDIRGFLDTFINRDLNSSGNVVLVGFRDLTLNAANTITSGAGNGLNIQAANGNQNGTGRLNVNGTLSNGTGALTLLSGINGTRPIYTATTTNLIRQGATFGAIDIRGFANFTLDRLFNSTGAVSFTSNTQTTLQNNITSTASNITFNTNPVVVAEGFSPTISTGNGAITFDAASTILDTAGGGAEGLTLSAGTGTITSPATINGVALNANAGTVGLTGVLGGVRALGNSVITSTANALTLPAITALSLNASAAGGTNQLIITGPIATTGAGGLTLTSAGGIAKTGTGNLSTVNAPLTLTAATNLFFNNAGTNLNSGGGVVTLNAPQGIVNAQSLTINSANGNLNLNGPVIIGAPLVLNLGAGSANFASTINGTAALPTFDVLLVGAGGGGGGADTAAFPGGGGGSGAAVDTTVNTAATGSIYTISVGGGGGGGNANVTNNGRGAGGTNGGALGGNAGTMGASGGGGGGGGFSGIAIGGTFFGVAGGGAGGGGGNEGTANDVQAPGGGLQPNGATGSTTGGAGAQFTGDGGGGGGGGGGFLGGNGQTNLTTSGQASGGSNFVNAANASSTMTNGNNGNTQPAGAAGGAATSISGTQTTYYNYAGAGAGGNGVPNGAGTAGGNGVVIIRYTGTGAQALATGNFTTTTVGSDTIVTYNSGTTNSFVPLSACTGNCNLTINAGTVNFGGAIGGTNALDDVTINATNAFTLPSLSARSLDVTGNTNLNGNILINNGPAAFNSPITLTGNSSINTGTGVVTFGSTVNGAQNLTVDAAGVSLGGAIGGTTPLANLAVTTTNALNVSQNISAAAIVARTTGATSDITIDATRSLTANGAGDAITLASGRNFINNSGLGLATLNLTGTGRYLIYSVQPSSDTTGGLARDFRRFSCAFASVGSCLFNATINNTVTIPAAGNGFIYSSTPGTLTLTISSIGNVIFGNSVNLVGLATDPTTLGQYLNASDFANDVITGSITGSTTYVPGPTNGGIGTYNIDYASGTLVSELGYNINYANNPTAFTVIPRTVTVSLVGPISRVYDGTLTATLTGSNYSIGNLFAGDVLGISNTSGTYDTRDAGTGKTVTVTGLNLTGAPVANYVLASTTAAGALGTITQRVLTIGAVAANRVYNGLSGASVVLSDDRVAGDTLTTGFGAANFDNRNAGTGKTVTVTGITLGGADAGNYSFNTSATTTADITQRLLTIGAVAANRVYNGLSDATVVLNDDRVAGDTLTTGFGAANFDNRNAGTGKTVTVTGITLGGADAGNYSFNTSATTTADITQRLLTIGAVGIDRPFDGTTIASVTLNDDRLAGDILTTGFGAANFATSLPGTGILITVSGITLGGADAGNYSFNSSATTTAAITGSVPLPAPTVSLLPDTVVRVTQNTGETVTAPADDGIYASPTSTYQLVYLPANAPTENRILNRAPLLRTAPSTAPSTLTTTFVLPDEEKRLRNARTKHARSLLAPGRRSFIFDANIPLVPRLGGFEASPQVKSI